MPDLPRKSVTCPMVRARARAGPKSYSLAPNPPGIIDGFFLSFLRADAVEIDAIS